VYDEKSLIEATLYGLPMLNVSMPVTQPIGGSALTSNPNAPLAIDSSLERITVTLPLTPTQHDTPNGTYFSIAGEVQGYPGRPVQPRTTRLADLAPRHSLRGLLLISAVYSDIAPFDPVVTIPVTDVQLPEPPFNAAGWFPAKFWAANRFGDEDRLVIVGGQYNGDGSVERLYSSVVLNSYYTPDGDPLADDYLSPTIWNVSAELAGGGFNFSVDTEDFSSGVARVLITYNLPNPDGSGVWQSIDLAFDPQSSLWVGSVASLDVSTEYFVQAMDAAGNVTVSSNKGEFFTSGFATYLPLVMREYLP